MIGCIPKQIEEFVVDANHPVVCIDLQDGFRRGFKELFQVGFLDLDFSLRDHTFGNIGQKTQGRRPTLPFYSNHPDVNPFRIAGGVDDSNDVLIGGILATQSPDMPVH